MCVSVHLGDCEYVLGTVPTKTEDNHMVAKVKFKVKLSERAVLARVNRALAKNDEILRICRKDSRGHLELGRFYSVDLSRDVVKSKGVDLEKWAREMKVMKPYETLDT